MYDEKFKETILEDFKTCPYYKTISRKYDIGKETLRSWVKKANIDVENLRESIKLSSFKLQINPVEIAEKEKYDTVAVITNSSFSKDEDKEILFEINGYKIKISNEHVKEFMKGLKND